MKPTKLYPIETALFNIKTDSICHCPDPHPQVFYDGNAHKGKPRKIKGNKCKLCGGLINNQMKGGSHK